MFEDVFVSDNMVLNIFVFILNYWYLIVGIFVPAFYYIFLKIFTFPLITRKAHEFVLVITPENVKIKKIVARLAPFFVLNRNLYWFGEPCADVNTLNRYNVYVEGINQNIADTDRNNNKTNDLTKEIKIPKQIGTHKILLPKNIRQHFNRHFILVINQEGKAVELRMVPERQPLRVSFYHTLGVYVQRLRMQTKEEAMKDAEENAGQSGSSRLQLVQLNTQLVMEQIKFASAHRNYSSHYAFLLSKKVKTMERYWMIWLLGSLDPKVLLAFLAIAGMGIAMFLVMKMMPTTASLGPIPTG